MRSDQFGSADGADVDNADTEVLDDPFSDIGECWRDPDGAEPTASRARARRIAASPLPLALKESASWPFDDLRLTGSRLLLEVYAFLGRFVAYPSAEAHIAHTLWCVHAHAMDAWESTPRIAFLSPEPGSGKTRALEVTELLVPNPVVAVNVTPAYLFRKVGGAVHPTILFDEIDCIFGPKARDNEEIRGLLNAGHRRGAVVGRCVGKRGETEEILAYSAVALAGLGNLPDTILTRSVIVHMRRRAPNEAVEPFRHRDYKAEGKALCDRLAHWAASQIDDLAAARPKMPEGIADRDADVWEALLAVADAAGGNWPRWARSSCVSLVSLAKGRSPSLGIRLLADLRVVFGDADAMPTKGILHALHAIEEAPWADIKGKPLDARGLSARLKDYDIRPKQVRIGEWSGKGYAREDLHDAWVRYLAPLPMDRETPETEDTAGPLCAHCGMDEMVGNPVLQVTDGGDLTWVHRACITAWGER
jgi:hypothetical protein